MGNEYKWGDRPDPDWRAVQGTAPLDPNDEDPEDGTPEQHAAFARITGSSIERIKRLQLKKSAEDDLDGEVAEEEYPDAEVIADHD